MTVTSPRSSADPLIHGDDDGSLFLSCGACPMRRSSICQDCLVTYLCAGPDDANEANEADDANDARPASFLAEKQIRVVPYPAPQPQLGRSSLVSLLRYER